MRYRRVSYRYALLVTGNQERAFGDPLAAVQPGVRFAETFWRPPADVCESATTIVVTVDLAGIDVVLFEDALIVEGRRRLPADPGVVYHVAEIRQGPFRLELGLPGSIDQERVDARYDQGLLRITFLKTQANAR
ncbi:MAG: Hsp20/alpha crystallin family protein [Thermomicrobiales bacterium]|nr:Hsp20/alpha crystallin family protein [Thermomicrobiales bacterium]